MGIETQIKTWQVALPAAAGYRWAIVATDKGAVNSCCRPPAGHVLLGQTEPVRKLDLPGLSADRRASARKYTQVLFPASDVSLKCPWGKPAVNCNDSLASGSDKPCVASFVG